MMAPAELRYANYSASSHQFEGYFRVVSLDGTRINIHHLAGAAKGSGFYPVINRHSGKDMVVQSASTANGANVFQYACGGSTTNDEWQPVSLGGGYYRIVNRHSGKVLNVSGASASDGANVDQWGWANVTQQQFQLVSLP